MRHIFVASVIGWGNKQDAIWFDTDKYSLDEAWAQFNKYQATNQRGYPYTGYEYDGKKYHDVTYIGEFENDKMPLGPWDLVN